MEKLSQSLQIVKSLQKFKPEIQFDIRRSSRSNIA